MAARQEDSLWRFVLGGVNVVLCAMITGCATSLIMVTSVSSERTVEVYVSMALVVTIVSLLFPVCLLFILAFVALMAWLSLEVRPPAGVMWGLSISSGAVGGAICMALMCVFLRGDGPYLLHWFASAIAAGALNGAASVWVWRHA